MPANNTGFFTGNIEAWVFSVNEYLPKVFDIFLSSVDPVIYASLIELVGSNSKFEKERCDVSFAYNRNNIPVTVTFNAIYSVPSFKTSNADAAAIQHDCDFVYSNIRKLPSLGNLSPAAIKIDTMYGRLITSITLAIGVTTSPKG